MGASILNGAQIGANCLVGANALVTEGKVFEDGSLIVGAPAKALRPLSDQEIEGIRDAAASYIERWQYYARELEPLLGQQVNCFGSTWP
jgi:carbonic anhydrase/acetyltransferase-like protein (isoleucine patch superfamily)